MSEKGRRRKSKFNVKEILNIQDRKSGDVKPKLGLYSPLRKPHDSNNLPTDKEVSLDSNNLPTDKEGKLESSNRNSKNKHRSKSSEWNEPISEAKSTKVNNFSSPKSDKGINTSGGQEEINNKLSQENYHLNVS